MKKRYILGIFFLLLLISFVVDKEITLFLNLLRTSIIHNFFILIGFLSDWYFLLIIFSLLFLLKKKELLFPFWASFFITGLLAALSKYIIQRPRPFEVLNLGVTHTFSSWNSSFPSWHAASIFLILPFLYLSFPKFKWLWIFLGSIIAFSRIYIGVHYLSDVFGGIILGLGISYSIIFLKKKLKW